MNEVNIKIEPLISKQPIEIGMTVPGSKGEQGIQGEKGSGIIPSGEYATLALLQTAFPTGNANIYIIASDGKWYRWSGTAWTAGGVFITTQTLNNIQAEVTSFKEDYVTQAEFPVTNLITNGDFSNGTTGWTVANANPPTVADGAIAFTATVQNGRLNKTVNLIQNHIYYKSADITSDSTLVNTQIDGAGIIYHSGNGLQKLSNIFKWTSTTGSWSFRVQDTRTSGWTPITIDNVLIINLTAMFGEGKEPTALEMGSMLAKFPNSWFDGTVNLKTLRETYIELKTEKANKVQEAWITPTLLNGWTSVVGYPVRYYKDSLGTVHFKGRLTGGLAGSVALQLPFGYRPNTQMLYPCPQNAFNTFVRGLVQATGDIQPCQSAYTDYVDVSPIIFKAE